MTLGYVSVGCSGGKCTDRTICDVQKHFASAGSFNGNGLAVSMRGQPFTKKTADYELNVGRLGEAQRAFSYLHQSTGTGNVPAREITDYRTADMINLDVPEKNVHFLSYPPTIEQGGNDRTLVIFCR